MDRAAALSVPDHHRLALVGQADGRDVGKLAARRLDRLAQHLDAGREDLPGVMLDPAVGGIGLRQRPSGGGQGLACGVEQDGAGRGGALVEGEQQWLGHGVIPRIRQSDDLEVKHVFTPPRAVCGF